VRCRLLMSPLLHATTPRTADSREVVCEISSLL
jgi:hypothetical protein